jgi:hypothetical protein
LHRRGQEAVGGEFDCLAVGEGFADHRVAVLVGLAHVGEGAVVEREAIVEIKHGDVLAELAERLDPSSANVMDAEARITALGEQSTSA